MNRLRVTGDCLFTFAVIADTHITEAEATAVGGYDVDTVALGAARSAYVIRELNRLAPEFVIHLGDITHPEPGTPAYEDSASRFHSVYEALECPLHLVAGNHDIGEKAFVGEPLPLQQAQGIVNDEMIAEYERHFQSQYYAFKHRGCLFIILNGMIINSGLPCENQQGIWLENLLETNRSGRIFMFSHYPAYLSRPDETDHYDATDEPGRSWLLSLFRRHRIEAFYAGHVHNFFFNIHAETCCYVLPSTCFLRHDYHELFRVAPGMKQGRHDSAKLGFAVVQIHAEGHLNHIIRTHGRTHNSVDGISEKNHSRTPSSPLIHALAPNHRGVGLYLRQPWCDRADIPTPWGLDPFHRKHVRNDYPLLALWEMGVRDLRLPLDDLTNPHTLDRVSELAKLGHRFTAYSYGLPKGKAREALVSHRHTLRAWELIAPITSAPELLPGIATLKGTLPVYFNTYRADGGTFSSSHGLDPDERGAIRALISLVGATEAIDGIVFGIDWCVAPIPAMVAANNSIAGLGVMAAVHVQFTHLTPLDQTHTHRHEINRIAETVVGALSYVHTAVFLDNFTGIDRGYYFSGGLVDRLYNPISGAEIVRNVQATLRAGCTIETTKENKYGRAVKLQDPDVVLLLPSCNTEPENLPYSLSTTNGRWIDLISGESTCRQQTLNGPTLITFQ